MSVPIKPNQTLREIIERGSANLYLVHGEADVGQIPIGILDAADVSAGALDEFTDLLNARVVSVRPGAYGQELELADVAADRLVQFDQFLAHIIYPSPRMTL